MSEALKTKRRQYILGAGILGILVIVILSLLSFFDRNKTIDHTKAKNDLSETNVMSAHNKVDPQVTWRAKMEDEQDRVKNYTNELKEMLANYQKEAEYKQEEMRNLMQQLTVDKEQALANAGAVTNVATEPQAGKISKITLQLDKEVNKALTTVDNTIPAGTFARAVLLSGVDAITSINVNADPRPMLLRIIDFGNMPRKFKTDLVDCHCTAAAWGELSSERVHTRIERLSCIERASGEIIEIEAKGYLAGSDGKEGIRGIVASKDGQFLSKSLWGGVFAGIGAVLSPANKQAQNSPFISIGGAPPKMSTKDMFKTGFGESANTALNKLSEYYIQRAEQIQPVIQVAAGQEVDLIFTEGVAIDQSLLKQTTANTNDQARKKAIIQEEGAQR